MWYKSHWKLWQEHREHSEAGHRIRIHQEEFLKAPKGYMDSVHEGAILVVETDKSRVTIKTNAGGED
jgi:hypothetical protein